MTSDGLTAITRSVHIGADAIPRRALLHAGNKDIRFEITCSGETNTNCPSYTPHCPTTVEGYGFHNRTTITECIEVGVILKGELIMSLNKALFKAFEKKR